MGVEPVVHAHRLGSGRATPQYRPTRHTVHISPCRGLIEYSIGMKPLTLSVKRIVSGGQTGVDRGALDAAIVVGIDHGGWCPLGRLAEDGRIPKRYHLHETDSSDYAVRTEQNVIDSDATLILHVGTLSGGTELTRRLSVKHNRPNLLVDLADDPDPHRVRQWLEELGVEVLNVAGPRGSSLPGLNEESRDFLVRVFRDALD